MWPFRYPYTNFHELNLDWILAEINKLPDMVRDEVRIAVANIKPSVDGAPGLYFSANYTDLQESVDAAYGSGFVILNAGTYIVHKPVVNRGVTIIGVGANLAQIQAANDFVGENVLTVKPDNGSDISGLQLCGFMVNGNTVANGINIDSSHGTNANGIIFDSLDIRNCITYSIKSVNTVNVQGIPANGVIRNCKIWQKLEMLGIGDNNIIENNYFEGPVKLTPVSLSDGTSSVINVGKNRFRGAGTLLEIETGRMVRIYENNIEKTDSASVPIIKCSAVVNLEIYMNNVTTLANANASFAVDVTGTSYGRIENNTFNNGGSAGGIHLKNCDYIMRSPNAFLNNVNPEYSVENSTRIEGEQMPVSAVDGYQTSGNAVFSEGMITIFASATGNFTNGSGFAYTSMVPRENITFPAIYISGSNASSSTVTITTSGYFIAGQTIQNATVFINVTYFDAGY